MKHSNVLSALLLVSVPPSIVSALPARRAAPSAVDVLTFALTLEHIENTFYSDRLAKYSQNDFVQAGYPAWTRGRFEQIALHEKTHVQRLSSAISAAGAKVPKPCEYSFPDHDVKSFIQLSEDFETVGTSAYNGAIGLLSDAGKSEYVISAGSILSTEARQAAWINSAVLGSYPWSTAFETPLTMNEAFTIASGFIVRCPADNPTLIAHAYPRLNATILPSKLAGLAYGDNQRQKGQSFGAFLTGTETLFTPINDGGGIGVPNGMNGTVYVLVTSSNTTVTDETILAGPAILRFPYPSDP